MGELRTFTTRELNLFERKGLCQLIREEFTFEIENLICGTYTNNLLNLVNSYFGRVGKNNIGYPIIGAIGLSVSNDIIIQFYDEEEENCIFLCCSWKFSEWEQINIK